MARTYRLGALRRFGNAVTRALLATPWGPRTYVLVTVAGRKTGKPRSTPLRLLEHDGQRFLVAPYGPVGWVRNARAAGRVTLSRFRLRETVTVREMDPAECGPLLREYARTEPITRPYFDARFDDPPERFAAEAARHPVFRIGPPID